LDDAENIISALVDSVDCQAIMALACFTGLRPGEIQGLGWNDIERDWVHIRRSIVRGNGGGTQDRKFACIVAANHVGKDPVSAVASEGRRQ
jgi:integrase